MKRFITANGTAYNFMLSHEDAYKEALKLGAGSMYDVTCGVDTFEYSLVYFE